MNGVNGLRLSMLLCFLLEGNQQFDLLGISFQNRYKVCGGLDLYKKIISLLIVFFLFCFLPVVLMKEMLYLINQVVYTMYNFKQTEWLSQ